MNDLISREAALDELNQLSRDNFTVDDWFHTYNAALIDADGKIRELPSVQPETCAYWDRESNFCALHRPSAQSEYEELTPEEAASEIASGSTMSTWYWLDDMIQLKQMGYAICRKK